MTTILHIDSSAKKDGSITKKLTVLAVEKLKVQHPGAKVIYRNLMTDPINHIDSNFLKGIFVGGEFASHPSVILSNQLIEEIMAADILVIGAPMYNFSVPSQLKAWIDHICRAGLTFHYTEKGSVGLVLNKRAIIAVSHGGLYSEGPLLAYDHVSPFMRQVLGFIGIIDVEVIQAEKQSMGTDVAKEELSKAEKKIISAAI